MAFIYITCKDREEAKMISRHLLEKKLIACSNIFPVESMYWWEGKIQESSEFVIIGKSEKNKFEEIKNEVKKVHSYEVPCICMFDSETDEEYSKWVRSVVE